MNKISLVFGKEEIGFHFGLGFIGKLLSDLDCTLDELMSRLQKNMFKYIPVVMYEAHLYHCIRSKKECKYTSDTFTDMLDDNGSVMSENAAKCIEVFTATIMKDVPKAEKVNKTVGKKKASPKK